MSQSAPKFKLAYPPSLERYNTSPSAYLAKHFPHGPHSGVGTSAIVFDAENRVLLLRRAQHDTLPGLWEPAGGSADEADGSLLIACARELWEEAGLVAKRVVRIVSQGEGKEPGCLLLRRSGKGLVIKFAFEMQVDTGSQVRIDPNEHDAFVWVSEEGLTSRIVEGVEGKLRLTHSDTRAILLDAFRRRRVEEEEEATATIEQ